MHHHLKPVPQTGEKGSRHPGEEACLCPNTVPPSLIVGDGCDSVQPLALISCLFSLSAYPSVQMRFSVTLNLPEMKFSCKVRTVNRSEKMEQKKVLIC